MRALRFSSFGDVSVLHVEELPTPVPGPDEVLVQVHASSINPSDAKNVQGKMKQITLPRTPGQDFAGVVIAGDKEIIGQGSGEPAGMLGLNETEATPSILSFQRGARGRSQSLCRWSRLPA